MENTNDSPLENAWRKCSSCKKPIAFNSTYYVCSVSTCNAQRTGYVFCSVHCFERHLPGARHKDAGAIEKKSPAAGANPTSPAGPTPATTTSPPPGPQRVFARPQASPSPAAHSPGKAPQEVLVIASRLKEYIAARSEFNTSASVMDVLSEHLRIICDRAIDNARAEGRKTVMDRDFLFLKNK
jgi:hypothetical protein